MNIVIRTAAVVEQKAIRPTSLAFENAAKSAGRVKLGVNSRKLRRKKSPPFLGESVRIWSGGGRQCRETGSSGSGVCGKRSLRVKLPAPGRKCPGDSGIRRQPASDSAPARQSSQTTSPTIYSVVGDVVFAIVPYENLE